LWDSSSSGEENVEEEEEEAIGRISFQNSLAI